MNFSDALTAIKDGKYLTRTGWHTKDAVIYLIANRYDPNNLPYIELRTVSGGKMYSANAADLLSEDWEIRE